MIPGDEPLQPFPHPVPFPPVGPNQCPRCGFSVIVSSPHTQEILDRHLDDCPSRPNSVQLKSEKREAKRYAFFERKQKERDAAKGVTA